MKTKDDICFSHLHGHRTNVLCWTQYWWCKMMPIFPRKCKRSSTRLKSPTTSTNMSIKRSTVNLVKFGNFLGLGSCRISCTPAVKHDDPCNHHGCCANTLIYFLHSVLAWTSICRSATKSMYSWFAMSCIRSTKHVSPKPVHVASHDAPDAVHNHAKHVIVKCQTWNYEATNKRVKCHSSNTCLFRCTCAIPPNRPANINLNHFHETSICATLFDVEFG